MAVQEMILSSTSFSFILFWNSIEVVYISLRVLESLLPLGNLTTYHGIQVSHFLYRQLGQEFGVNAVITNGRVSIMISLSSLPFDRSCL